MSKTKHGQKEKTTMSAKKHQEGMRGEEKRP